MAFEFIGQAAVIGVLLLFMMGVAAAATLVAMHFGPRAALIGLAAALLPASLLGMSLFQEGGALRELIHWGVASITLSEAIVLIGLLAVFTGMLWYSSDSVIMAGFFLPLATLLGPTITYVIQLLDTDNLLQIPDAALIGAGTSIGAVVSVMIVIAIVRAVPQRVD